jgi:hypothetical protein
MLRMEAEVSSKTWSKVYQLHSLISQNIVIFIVKATRISSFAKNVYPTVFFFFFFFYLSLPLGA